MSRGLLEPAMERRVLEDQPERRRAVGGWADEHRSGAPASPAPDVAPAIGDAWAHRGTSWPTPRLLGAHGELAEDVVQEAYLRLHQSAATAPRWRRPALGCSASPQPRTRQRRRGRRGDDVLSRSRWSRPARAGRWRAAGSRGARQALEGLDALPPRERRTVILEQAGLAPPAIARRIHTTTNTVHRRCSARAAHARRARRRPRPASAAARPPDVPRRERAGARPPPALAPGSEGRLAGGAGLAGLVAAAVIGGGVVADRPVVPPPSGPARAGRRVPGAGGPAA